MSPVYTSTESWWLKFKRAQRHVVEIRLLARKYAESHPYQVSRIREPERKGKRWRYQLVADPPNRMMAMALGDALHNLRSALDHAIIACSKQEDRFYASYPLTRRGLLDTDSIGGFIDPDEKAREDFNSALRGVSDDVRAIVIRAYSRHINPGESDILHLIGRLDNRDKHRQIILLGGSLSDGFIMASNKEKVIHLGWVGPNQFLPDNTEILSFKPRGSIREKDVEVKVGGTPTIQIEVPLDSAKPGCSYSKLIPTLVGALASVRSILILLAPHVIDSEVSESPSHGAPPP